MKVPMQALSQQYLKQVHEETLYVASVQQQRRGSDEVKSVEEQGSHAARRLDGARGKSSRH